MTMHCSALVSRRPVSFAVDRRRPGWSLLELLVVITVLSVLMTVVVATLTGAIRTDKAGAASFHAITAHGVLADQFRADVADAQSVPGKVADFTANPTCLILQTSDGHVIYQWDKDRLTRIDLSAKKKTQRQLSVAEKRAAIEFGSAKTAGQTLVTLRLKRDSRPPLEITAALGGDHR